MQRFLLYRILWLFPTLGAITIFTFILGSYSPNDPIQLLDPAQNQLDQMDLKLQAARQRAIRKEEGLDLPVFYLRIHPLAEPDTFHRLEIHTPPKAAFARQLLHRYGNWPAIQQYLIQTDSLHDRLLATTSLPAKARPWSSQLSEATSMQEWERAKDSLGILLQDSSFFQLAAAFNRLEKTEEQLQTQATRWKLYIPNISWYGADCQYHRWVSHFLRGDWGYSFRTKQEVGEIIRKKLPWTLTFSLLATLLVFLIGLSLGIRAGMYPGGGWDRASAIAAFMLEALPTFWVAGILIELFMDVDRFPIFPSTVVPLNSNLPTQIPLMALPLIAYILGNVSFLSRLMRNTLQDVLAADYMRTALAKGLSYRQAIWRHGIKNALLPIATYLGGILPGLFIGSAVIEQVFGVKQMGAALLEATRIQDTPPVMAMLVITGSMTVLGYLLSDWLYTWLDPRLRDNLQPNASTHG